MNPVRIGCVKYLNTLPLVQGLGAWRDATLVSAVPSRLIDLLMDDGPEGVDVALCSVIDAARAPRPVTLLPVGMIGCDGPTLTVRLFADRPVDDIDRLWADTDSHTSVALARVILHARSGGAGGLVPVSDFDARDRASAGAPAGEHFPERAGWPPAVLLIGDKVVTDAPPKDLYPVELDLGEAWHAMTGLPFVYALWMCRAGEESRPEIRAAAAVLDRARRHNATRADWLVGSSAPERRWPEALASTYLGELLRYDVGDREREAVGEFLRRAADLGLAPRVEPAWGAGAGTA
jgi:chorismate dehydratase